MNKLIKVVGGGLLLFAATGMQADQVILDDLIVDGSTCVGLDCVNGESFGFDTIRLKENNLRIKAQDTSSTASFPTRDWQITFNDSSNGGLNKFSIDDIDGGRTPFTIEGNAPSHSLYVDDGGRVGFGTNTPVVDLHVKSGNTPTLRLEQDGSSGFTPQTWDVAGNEANFFIRDATNGSTLPFRIFPGAPSNAINIEATTGDVGIGITSPEVNLHVVETTVATNTLLRLTNPGEVKFQLEDNVAGVTWGLVNAVTGFRVSRQSSGVVEMEVLNNGNMTISGLLTQNSDVNVKTSIRDIDDLQILDRIETLPIQEWQYKDALGERHIGPMAQDFYAAFELGATETGISTIDTAGVALVAIKALIKKNRSLEVTIKQLQADNQEMVAMQEAQYEKLKAMVIDLQINANANSMLTSLQ